MMVEDRYLSRGIGVSMSMCCPLGISKIALISWQDGSQGIPSTGVDCHGSGLGRQNKVTSDLAEGPVGSFATACSFTYICP